VLRTSNRIKERRCGRLVDLPCDSNLGLAKNMRDLRFAEARRVVLEGELFLALVKTEASKTISVGKKAEVAKLLVRERLVQFVGDVDKGHRLGIIPVAACERWTRVPALGGAPSLRQSGPYPSVAGCLTGHTLPGYIYP